MQDKFPSGIKDEQLMITIISKVLLAIEYLHTNNHMHR